VRCLPGAPSLRDFRQLQNRLRPSGEPENNWKSRSLVMAGNFNLTNVVRFSKAFLNSGRLQSIFRIPLPYSKTSGTGLTRKMKGFSGCSRKGLHQEGDFPTDRKQPRSGYRASGKASRNWDERLCDGRHRGPWRFLCDEGSCRHQACVLLYR
jgi:hypothetical protein